MKIRAHRALLEDAMKMVSTIPPTKRGVFMYFYWQHYRVSPEMAQVFQNKYSPDDIEVKPYYYDSRIEWDTHIVTLKGDAIGFTDGPLKDL